jgi:hypothetical protein
MEGHEHVEGDEIRTTSDDSILSTVKDFVIKYKLPIAIVLIVAAVLVFVIELIIIIVLAVSKNSPPAPGITPFTPPVSSAPTVIEYNYLTQTCTDQWYDAEEFLTSYCACSKAGGCEMFTCTPSTTTYYGSCNPTCSQCNVTRTVTNNACNVIGQPVTFQCGTVVGKNYTKTTYDHLTGCVGRPHDILHMQPTCDVGVTNFCVGGKMYARTFVSQDCTGNYTDAILPLGVCYNEAADNYLLSC